MKKVTPYDKKPVQEIEREIKDNRALSLEARKDAIFALCYLRDSGRYKENPQYKKSSFDKYLMGHFNMRNQTFLEEARAFRKFPDETCQYGVGLISKIHRQCGAKVEADVIRAIKTADDAKPAPIQRDKIDEIIQKFSRPTPPAKASYKELYVGEVKKNEMLQEKYRAALDDLVAARVQIGKLKKTIIDMKIIFAEELEVEAA